MLTFVSIALFGAAFGLDVEPAAERPAAVAIEVSRARAVGDCGEVTPSVWVELCDSLGQCVSQELPPGAETVVDIEPAVVTLSIVSAVAGWDSGVAIVDSFVDAFDVAEIELTESVWQPLAIDRCNVEHELKISPL